MFGRMFAACLLVVWPGAGWAHVGLGPHGGPVSDAGPYWAELVMHDKELQVFVFDQQNDTPIGTADATGRAEVLVGEDKETVRLQPGTSAAEVNMMKGEVVKDAGAGTRIVVLIQFPGKPAAVARFAI
jgi:hypothetical protein